MKETRIYILDADLIEDDFNIDTISDEGFMNLCEDKGDIFTLKGFEKIFNTTYMGIPMNNHFIRFIEVDVHDTHED